MAVNKTGLEEILCISKYELFKRDFFLFHCLFHCCVLRKIQMESDFFKIFFLPKILWKKVLSR